MSTPNFQSTPPDGSTTTGVFAAAPGYLSAVEVHDPASKHDASWSGGTSKTQPERPILNELHLFAGCGGGILGGILLGHHPVCAVEIEPYCRRVLLQRQRDGVLPRFPIWDDVRTFDGKPWRGRVDVVCGGFPCQDISCASKGGDGLDGERSGLWTEMRRIIGEVRPKFVFVENSPMLVVGGLDRILGHMAAMGYNAAWGIIGANSAGARHKRERIWIVGHAAGADVEEQVLVETKGTAWKSRRTSGDAARDLRALGWEADEPDMVGTSHDYASWVVRSRAIGNGQVPAVAAMAWRILSNRISQ